MTYRLERLRSGDRNSHQDGTREGKGEKISSVHSPDRKKQRRKHLFRILSWFGFLYVSRPRSDSPTTVIKAIVPKLLGASQISGTQGLGSKVFRFQMKVDEFEGDNAEM